MKPLLSLIIPLACIALAGCGYRFAGTEQLPGNARDVHVAVIENPTGETGIEVLLSNALIHEFIVNGHHVAASPETADAVLRGRIAALHIDSVSRESAQVSLAGRVSIVIDLVLADKNGNEIWSADGISGSQAYDISTGGKLQTEADRRDAIKTLSDRLAEIAYDRLTTDF